MVWIPAAWMVSGLHLSDSGLVPFRGPKPLVAPGMRGFRPGIQITFTVCQHFVSHTVLCM